MYDSQALAGYASGAFREEEFHRKVTSLGCAHPFPISWTNIPITSEYLGEAEDEEASMRIKAWPVMLPSQIAP